MEKEKILELAKLNKQDERVEAILLKAHKMGSDASFLFVSILSLIVAYDGYIIGSGRTYDFLTVFFLLLGTFGIYSSVLSLYQLITLNKYSKIYETIIFGILTVSSVVRIITFFLG